MQNDTHRYIIRPTKNECQNSKVCFPLSRRTTFAENKPIRMSNKTIPNWRIIGVFVLFTLFYKSLHLFLLSPRTSSERKFKWTRELSLATITKFTRQSCRMFSWYRSSSVSHTVCYMSVSWFSDNHSKNLNFLALYWTPCEFKLPCRSWHFADCILFSVCWLSKRKGTLILLISLLCPFHVKRMRSCSSGIV